MECPRKNEDSDGRVTKECLQDGLAEWQRKMTYADGTFTKERL